MNQQPVIEKVGKEAVADPDMATGEPIVEGAMDMQPAQA